MDRYEDLLARPNVDCILIAGANFVHKEQTVAALGAGKHVLCEKPMATNREDALAVHDAARGARTIYQIGLEMRYSKGIEPPFGWVGHSCGVSLRRDPPIRVDFTREIP